MSDTRQGLLQGWAGRIDEAAVRGVLTSQPLTIRKISYVTGPRAGALEIDAGLDAGRLYRALSADDMALTRQFVTWNFVGTPACYLQGRYIRIEAGWEDGMAQKNISVRDLNARPTASGHWLAGMNENGRSVVLHFSDSAPHFLVCGATGSGKSVCVRSQVAQLSLRGDQLVLIDGKFSDGLRDLDHLAGIAGPLATTIESARAALAWVIAVMTRRYETNERNPQRLCVVIDEVQELITDQAIAEMIRRIAAQGRAAKVSLILTTQHPTAKALGDDPTIKRNITGRIALMVSDSVASQVAIGQSTPRADWLLGSGDAYIVVPGQVQRLQIAYYERRELSKLLIEQPQLPSWPDYVAEDLPVNPNVARYSGKELALSLIGAYHGVGLPSLLRELEAAGLGRPGNVRGDRLLKLGRVELEELRASGWDLCLTDETEDDDETENDGEDNE